MVARSPRRHLEEGILGRKILRWACLTTDDPRDEGMSPPRGRVHFYITMVSSNSVSRVPFPGLCPAALTLAEFFSGLPLSCLGRPVVQSELWSCVISTDWTLSCPDSRQCFVCICCPLSELFVYTFLLLIINSSRTRPSTFRVPGRPAKFEV